MNMRELTYIIHEVITEDDGSLNVVMESGDEYDARLAKERSEARNKAIDKVLADLENKESE